MRALAFVLAAGCASSPKLELRPATAAVVHQAVRDAKARAVLVNVWATWCDPCKEEMPDLLSIRTRLGPRGFALVLVSADFPDVKPEAEAFLRSQGVDFTTSNVRGAPVDLFIGGAHIDANYPLGPIAGTAFNATVLSVAGSLDIGVHVDAGAVADPTALRDHIQAAFDELLALG